MCISICNSSLFLYLVTLTMAYICNVGDIDFTPTFAFKLPSNGVSLIEFLFLTLASSN